MRFLLVRPEKQRLVPTVGLQIEVTSTNGMIRRMGRKAWERLHWLIYPLAILAVAHNLLMVKIIDGDPTIHAVILAVLLLWRLGRWGLKRLKPAEAAA
jgi:sulfoxide reductase heme-binding subunit YedZ